MTLTIKNSIATTDFTINDFNNFVCKESGSIYGLVDPASVNVKKGSVYASADNGKIFSLIKDSISAGLIRSICCSSTGTTFYAVDINTAGYSSLLKSTTSGSTFTTITTNIPFGNGYYSDCSGDGTKLIVTGHTSTTSYLYISNDSGITFTAKGSALTYKGAACSYDFTKVFSCAYGDKIYVSNDNGETFTGKDSNRNWTGIACSFDGKYLCATVDAGNVYISSDYGDTWASKLSAKAWNKVSVSKDGSIMIVSNTTVSDGAWISVDYGANWTNVNTTGGDLRYCQIKNNGEVIIGVNLTGYIHTSVNNGTTWKSNRLNSGSWTSPAINPNYALDAITFGYLKWDELNTDNESLGTVRVDIKSSDLVTTYIADIMKNSDGSASNIYTGDIPSATAVKLVFRLYQINNADNIAVNNIELRHNLWKDVMVFNNKGKTTAFDREFNTSQTYTKIDSADVGYTTATTFTESDTTLPSKQNVSSFLLSKYAEDLTDNTVTYEFLIDETDTYIPAASVFNCMSLNNSDATNNICALIKFGNITKNNLYRYYYRIKFRILNDSTSKLLTNTMKNEILYRLFNTYTQASRVGYVPAKSYIGYNSTFTDATTDMTYKYGATIKTGTNTSVTTNKLVDSGGLGSPALGMSVSNDSEGFISYITGLDSGTTVSLYNDIFDVPGITYSIYNNAPVAYNTTAYDATNYKYTTTSIISQNQGNEHIINLILHVGNDSNNRVLGGSIISPTLEKTSSYSYIFIDNFIMIPTEYDL